MGVEQSFLGWERPFLHSVAGWLVERSEDSALGAALDVSGFTVVTPSRAAGRRLREVLLERAEERGGLLIPPRVLTPRALLDLLLGIDGARISRLEAELVMTCALRELDERDPAELRNLVRHPPEDDGAEAWSALGARLVRIRDEVAGAGLGVDASRWPDEAQRCLSVGTERRRWATLKVVFDGYEEILASMERRDWVMALREVGSRSDLGSVVLAGVSDLFPAIANLLRDAAHEESPVHVLVRAPEGLKEGFDDLGNLNVSYWLQRRLDIPDEAISVVEAPVDQARAVAQAIGALDGAFDVSEISLALANPALAPHIEDELASRGVATRYAGGRPAGRTSPYLLLSELARYTDGRSFGALASLARHPDLRADTYVLQSLDMYAREHLPARAPRKGQGPGAAPPDIPEEGLSSAQRRRKAIDGLVGRVDFQAGELAYGRPLSLSAMAQAVRRALQRVYENREFDQARREERARLMALEEISGAAEGFEDLPEPLARRVGERPPAELLRLLLRHASERAVPDPENPLAIEMTDWLEVVLDDAPVLVIAGLNEGLVPQSIVGDPLLPDGLRAALGVAHNDQRMAREVHALTSMMEERATGGRVAIVTGRVDASREPLVPSRLLLRGSRPQDVISRTQMLFREAVSGAGLLHPALTGVSPGPGLERILPTTQDAYPYTSLSVTAFKDYLACPYRFWLEKVMGLRELDDRALELDAARFGTMVHAVLERFGLEEELKHCSDAERIDRALGSFLDDFLRDEFGDNARRTVAIQASLARRRLSAFAPRQAARVAEGWRTIAVEHRVAREDEQVALELPTGPLYVHGRIDRVDLHEDGRLAVLDYKTSSDVPDAAHRKGPRNAKTWVDLQLPLYRKLATTIQVPHTSVVTGYALLPRDPARAGFHMADWSEAELEEADELAKQVATSIRERRFWPPAQRPPMYSEALAGICQDEALNARPVPEWSEGDGGAP